MEISGFHHAFLYWHQPDFCRYLPVDRSGTFEWHGGQYLWGEIWRSFLFQCPTFTTVGYGRINPVGFLASFVASFEALTGLMSFALVTGMLYGRFARPRSFIRYSHNALFSPFKDGVALMFRMVPYTKNYLVNVEVKVTIAMKVLEDGMLKNKFFNMPLDISKASTMTANWTLVHPINEESPLFQTLQS